MEYPGPVSVNELHEGESSVPSQSGNWVTPYRIVLVDLLHRFLQTSRTNALDIPSGAGPAYLDLSYSERIQLCENVLTWILGPDLEWSEMKQQLEQLSPGFMQAQMRHFTALKHKDMEALMGLFKSVEKLLTGSDKLKSSVTLDVHSPVGLFLRRNVLMFKSLSIVQVSKLHRWYCVYLRDTPANEQAVMSFICDLSVLSLDEDASILHPVESNILYSKRQAEYFISQQVNLILNDESKALSPQALQSQIDQLLKCDSRQSEILYLSYLNSLRVRDFTVCLNTLIHYFDTASNAMGASPAYLDASTPQNEDIAKSFRFASLNIAILHVKLEQWEMAEKTLKEAIRMSLEANDTVCLQHALLWLDIIEEHNSDQPSLADTQDVKSASGRDVNLRTLLQRKLLAGQSPASVISLVDGACKSTSIASNHNTAMSHSWSTAAADQNSQLPSSTLHLLQGKTWSYYGFPLIASVYYQLALLSDNRHSANFSSSLPNSESCCIAFTELAGILWQLGHGSHTSLLLHHLSENYKNPNSTSKHWIICKFHLMFKSAVAEQNLKKMKFATDGLQSHCPQLFRIHRFFTDAVQRKSMSAYEGLTAELDNISFPDLKVHIHEILADFFFDAQEFAKSITCHLNPALEICRRMSFQKLQAEISAKIAVCYFMLGESEKAIESFEAILPVILMNSDIITKSSVLLWTIKSRVSLFNTSQKGDLVSIHELIEFTAALLKDSELLLKIKELLFLKAVVLKMRGFVQESYDCAKKFRTIECEPKSGWLECIF